MVFLAKLLPKLISEVSPQVSSLDDVKTIQNDSNAAKTIALDHLGVIAARLRTSTLKFKPNSAIEGQGDGGFLKPLEEVISRCFFLVLFITDLS
jgi:hypothetical protein